MTQTVINLIEKAKAIPNYEDNTEVVDAVEKLEALGDDAKGSTNEYKELNALLEDVVDTEPKAKAKAKEEPKKKLNVKGIKMIGRKHYHESDNYAKGFDTVEECAKHYNG